MKKSGKSGGWVKRLLLALPALVLLLAGASALSNINLPHGPDRLDRLSPMDKARLAESLRLKSALGEAIWPGWAEMDTPFILWNRSYEFLIGLPGPVDGWEAVPDDTFAGQVYYRRPAHNPQNFAVPVAVAGGEVWAASIGTKWEADLFLREMFQEVLPPPLAQIVPYRLLILPSEVQITGALHESFHVYQAQAAPERLSAAEAAQSREGVYFGRADATGDAWQEETRLLADALQAESDEDAAELARQFLALRDARRAESGMPPDLIDYERQLEWEEGLAKYVELAAWRVAWRAEEDQPTPALAEDTFFKGYATFNRRWSQELGVLARSGGEGGSTRFYYTGMAQATLLDRLSPGWKEQAMQPDVWLEDLLAAMGK